MSYQTGQAFRRALEARLLNQSIQGAVSLVRLRKLVAFDRFLARLLAVRPDGWMLKGGLAFAGIPPLTLPCYPLSQHLAEKVHAYVKPRASGESTRVKDLVDILLVAAYSPVAAPALRAAILATFTAQGSEAPPTSLPEPPAAWTAKYRKLAQESGMVAVTLSQALAQAQEFLDPVLSGQTHGTWAPERQAWS